MYSRRPSWTSQMRASSPSSGWRPQTPTGPQTGGYQPQMPPMQYGQSQQAPAAPPPQIPQPGPPSAGMMARGPSAGLPAQVPVNQPALPQQSGLGQGLLSFFQNPESRQWMQNMGMEMLKNRFPSQLPAGGGMAAPQPRQTMPMPQATPWWGRVGR